MAPAKRRGRPRRSDAVPLASNDLDDETSTTMTIQADEDTKVAAELTTEASNGEFIPPSILSSEIFAGRSYTFHSPIPKVIDKDSSAPVTLGVDEAGRGPVLGPMVYGVAYCLSPYEKALNSIGFDDSKKLTPDVRANLMKNICSLDSDLNCNVGWAVRVMSARDISAGMLRPAGVGTYNLNAQAHDATIALIQDVLAKGVNVKEIFVDTVGPPATYQAKLARIFPSCRVTVSKKADSLYPSVSVASVVAKVSRDFGLEEYFRLVGSKSGSDTSKIGSGYPSDPKTVAFLRGSLDDVFGWGSEARFSWSTAADMLKKDGEMVDWAEKDDDSNADVASLMFGGASGDIKHWFGKPTGTIDL